MHWIVIQELPETFDTEYKWLMEFSVGEKRKKFLKKLLTNLQGDENNDLVKFAMPLYTDEIVEIMKNEGITMTMVEKNIFKWADQLGILEKAKNDGIENTKLETAKKMIDEGMDNKLISKITGLSVDEIKNVVKK